MRQQRRLTAVPDRPGRAVIYVRVSAVMGRGGEDFHSPDLQVAQTRRAIASAGMVEVDVIDDDIDQTGRTFQRKGMDKVRRLVEAGAIDAIAFYDIKRFGRNTLEGLKTLEWLDKRGVTIISACEQIDTSTPAGKWMLTNLLSMAQYQSDEIGKNWSQLIEKRAREGKQHSTRVGYIRVDKRLVPDPVMGPVMAEAFRRYAAGENGVDVARFIAAARGKPVHLNTLRRWLRNEVYRGAVTLNDLVMPGAHDPLVDEETWTRVQDRLARSAGSPPRERTPTWSMVSLAFCENGCGITKKPVIPEGGTEAIPRLLCKNIRSRIGGADCPGVGFPRLELVEAEVLRQVAEYYQHLRADVSAAAAHLDRRATLRSAAGQLRSQVGKTRAAMAKLTTAWALGEIPDREYQQSLGELREAEQLASAELVAIDGAAGGGGMSVAEAAKAVDAMLAMWPKMTATERNRALRALVRRVVIKKAAYYRQPEHERVFVEPTF